MNFDTCSSIIVLTEAILHHPSSVVFAERVSDPRDIACQDSIRLTIITCAWQSWFHPLADALAVKGFT